VESNEIIESLRGVSVFISDRVRIQGNTIARSLDTGIFASSATEISILDNRIESSRLLGISLQSVWYSNVSGNRITANADGLAIDRGWEVSVWLNEFSANSNHSLVVSYSSAIFVFSNNFDRVAGSIAMEASWVGFDQGWVTGGNYWAGHPITDRCSGLDQDIPCGSPDGFDDRPLLVAHDWREWYSLGEPAVEDQRQAVRHALEPVHFPGCSSQIGEEIAKLGSALVFLGGGGLLHLLRELFLHFLALTFEKITRGLDLLQVLVPRHIANARCSAVFQVSVKAMFIIALSRRQRTAAPQMKLAADQG